MEFLKAQRLDAATPLFVCGAIAEVKADRAPAVEMELPSDSFVGHVVGRNGCFVRRLLAEHDSVCRIRVQGAKVRIVGKQESLQEDVEAIAVKVRYQVFTTIYQSWKYLTAAARGRRPRRAGVTLPLGFPLPGLLRRR